MQFDRGYLSPYFVTNAERDGSGTRQSAHPHSREKNLESKDMLSAARKKKVASCPSALIIAEDVEGEALATLVVNKLRGTFHVCAVKAPGFGDRRKAMLEDIAMLTGGKCITEDLGLKLENVELEDLGKAKRSRSTRKTPRSSKAMANPPTSRRASRKSVADRRHRAITIARSSRSASPSSPAVWPSSTSAPPPETEMKEKKARVEDALHATRAAVEEGIVPGGGVAFIRAQKALDNIKGLEGDEQVGVQIVRRAIEEPLRQLADNAGQEGALIVQEVKARKGNEGYNVATEKYEDLVKAGVVDPTKVTRSALQNAASISGLLLTTEAIVTEMPEKEKGGGMPPGGMGGGMGGMGGMDY